MTVCSGTALPFARAFPLLTKTFQYNIWVYWVILAVCHAFDYYEKFHERALRASELESALAHYKRAVELQPNDADACLGIGKTLTQMHRPAEAEPYLKRAAQLEPFTAVTHYRLSLVYRAAGRTADAQRELAEYQKLKDMKEKLKQVYQEMRLQPVKQERPEAEEAK